jgi:hypothetical protein
MSLQTTTNKLYRTKDWQVASILYASGQILDNTEWQDGVCFFTFEDRVACEGTMLDFYKDELTLGAKAIFDSIGTIKNILRGRY